MLGGQVDQGLGRCASFPDPLLTQQEFHQGGSRAEVLRATGLGQRPLKPRLGFHGPVAVFLQRRQGQAGVHRELIGLDDV